MDYNFQMGLFSWIFWFWGIYLFFIVLGVGFSKIRLTLDKRAFLRRVPTPEHLLKDDPWASADDEKDVEEAERIWYKRKKETLMDEFMEADGRYNELVSQFFWMLAVFTGIAIYTWFAHF